MVKLENEMIRDNKELDKINEEIKSLENSLNKERDDLFKIARKVKKYNKVLKCTLKISIFIIFLSIILLVLDLEKSIYFLSGSILLKFGKDLWNNLFLVGLAGLSIFYIYYQIKESLISQVDLRIMDLQTEIIGHTKYRLKNLKKKKLLIKTKKTLIELKKYAKRLSSGKYKSKNFVNFKRAVIEWIDGIEDPDLKDYFEKMKIEINDTDAKSFRREFLR